MRRTVSRSLQDIFQKKTLDGIGLTVIIVGIPHPRGSSRARTARVAQDERHASAYGGS